MYGPESEFTYSDEAEIEGFFPIKYRCRKPPTAMFMSLKPTEVDENNEEVVKSELKTVFRIKVLGQHRSLRTGVNSDVDNYRNLTHTESVARSWLKDCLENQVICA